MADIQGKILGKYGIDITQEQIFKLYKIEHADMNPDTLEELISATRKRWNQSINGANDKNAARDAERLQKADKYELILRDEKLRKELERYYNKPCGAFQGSDAGVVGDTGFAREYFRLTAATKKLKKEDLDFFLECYPFEKKNSKAIRGMLEKEFKLIFLGDNEKQNKEEKNVAVEGKKKSETDVLIVNFFQRETIMNLQKCQRYYEEASQSMELRQRFPLLGESMYDFLLLNKIDTVQSFLERMSEQSKEVYNIRQEKGIAYAPLVDLFNLLKALAEYKDVADNFDEFKILLRYPNLSPYMYAIAEMKPETMKGLIAIGNKDYIFRDDTDFILNYYLPLRRHFAITDNGIASIIKKAEQKAKSNQLLNEIDAKLGRKTKRKIPMGAEVVHWLVYWPIFIAYFLFEICKAIFTELYRFTIPIFVVLFIGSNWIIPKITQIDNLLILRKIFVKKEWYAFLEGSMGKVGNGFEGFLLTLSEIVVLLVVYVLPSIFAVYFITEWSADLNRHFDWIGIERTFQNIMMKLREKTESQYNAQRKLFFRRKLPSICVNVVGTVLILAMFYYVPVLF